MPAASFLWRRLDAPGHDACRFEPLATGFRLAGMAAFLEAGRVCQLRYEVLADASFQTVNARVEGRVGPREVALAIRASRAGLWRVNGVEQPQLAGCIDLDLGFSPATNLLPIRRLRLQVGQAAEADAAYLEVPSLRMLRLPQRYRRTAALEYAYESPAHGYQATLKVTRIGAIAQYPGVFALE